LAVKEARSQAVARIADRTASQYLWGSGHHLIAHAVSYWWSFGTNPLTITVCEIFTNKCIAMTDMTLIRHLNKGQGHSFWYRSISHRTSYSLGYQ